MSLVLAIAVEDAVTASFSWTAVMVGVVLLLTNGYFTALEISLLAARRGRIEEAAESGDRSAQAAMRALRELPVTFSGAQLGITASSLGLGATAEPALAALFAELFEGARLPTGVVPIAAVAAALTLMVFLHMVIGDMAPKNVAIARAEQVAMRLARPFGWFAAVLRPLIMLLNRATNALVRLVGVEPVDERQLVHTPQELALALAESHDVGTIAPQDARLMDAVLRLASIDAEAAMTARVDLHAVEDTAPVAELLELALETGHTRIPVYHDDLDHIVGIVHVKDALIRDEDDQQRLTVTDLLRPISTVPESQDLEHLLRDMLDLGSHAVVVLDEFGGTAGLLTLEDVLEELVGEIADEFDTEPHPQLMRDRSWVVPGTMRRDEVAHLTGLSLVSEGDAETLSGYLVEQVGRLLEPGDVVWTDDGWRLTVRSLEGRRAGEVEIEAPAAVEDGAGPRPD